MKIRNGFVSNSSSCSYVLAYYKSKLIKGAENIVKYLQDNPSTRVSLLNNMCEGYDFFELTNEHKSLIRKFKDEFIKANKPRTWDLEEEFGGDIYLIEDENYELEYAEDKYSWGDTTEDIDKTTENLKEEVRKKLNPNDSDVVASKFWIDYGSFYTDGADTYDFCERYLCVDDIDEYEDSLFRKHYSKLKKSPYTLIYDKVIEDKKEIISYLEEAKGKNIPIGISWFNKVLETVDKAYTNIDIFGVGEKEIDVILKNKEEILNNNRSILLFTDFHAFRNGIITADLVGRKFTLFYGRMAYLESGGEYLTELECNLFGDISEIPYSYSEDYDDEEGY